MFVTESEQTSDKMGKTSGDHVKPIEDGVQPTQVNNCCQLNIAMIKSGKQDT